jgi:hypothetical protein
MSTPEGVRVGTASMVSFLSRPPPPDGVVPTLGQRVMTEMLIHPIVKYPLNWVRFIELVKPDPVIVI